MKQMYVIILHLWHFGLLNMINTFMIWGMLELQPKAKIVGDVYYTALEMHQGAVITGLLQPSVQEIGTDHKAPLILESNSN